MTLTPSAHRLDPVMTSLTTTCPSARGVGWSVVGWFSSGGAHAAGAGWWVEGVGVGAGLSDVPGAGVDEAVVVAAEQDRVGVSVLRVEALPWRNGPDDTQGSNRRERSSRLHGR